MILLVLLLFPLSVFAQSFEQLEKRLAQINTIKVSFVQRTKYPWRTKEDVAKGFFYAQKDGKFRIEYEQPEKMIIVSNGREVVLYYPAQGNALIDSMEKNQSPVVESLLLVSKPLGEVFDLVGEIEREGRKFFVLKPKVNDEFFHRVLVHADRDGTPRLVRVEEKDGTITEIEFLEVRTNFSPSQGLFKLQLPPNVKVKRVY
jgi:outer membrane lipoprotein carrier protein